MSKAVLEPPAAEGTVARSVPELVHELLTIIGEDPKRHGLLRTPDRVAKSYEFLTKGYRESQEDILNGAIFEEQDNEMIVARDLDLFSLCEHHLLPFFGRCHVAYIPNGKIIGISKIPRIVDLFARRLQVQERITRQVAETIQRVLNPLGVAVVIEAKHLCMMMRGVEKQNSEMVTSCMLGAFRNRPESRSEFLNLIRHRGSLI